MAVLTRKVMNLSLIFVFLSLVSCLNDIERGAKTDALWWLVVSLAMPYCGYYGAKHRDRNLLCMFYSINLAIAIMYVMVVLLVLVFIQAIDPAVQECLDHEPEGAFEEDVRMNDPEADQGVGGDDSAHEGEPMTAQDCEYWTRAQSQKFKLYTQVIICSCQIFLNCSAFSNGKRLATLPSLSPGDADRRAAPFTTTVEGAVARRQRAMELAMQRRQGSIVHAQVVESMAPPVVVPPPSHPRLRPGEVQARKVFEVETAHNPCAMATTVFADGEHGAAGGGGAPLMGAIVMGEPVYDDVEDPVCPASSDQRR